MLPPRLDGGHLVLHAEPLELLDVRFGLDAVQVFVKAVHEELTELLTVVLVRVVKLRRETGHGLLQRARGEDAVLATPHLFEERRVGQSNVATTPQWIGAVELL